MTLQHEFGHPGDGSVCTTPAQVHDFVSCAIANYDIDPDRVYLYGLSCGAFGWEYVAQYGGDQIAAMVPIADEGRPAWPESMCGSVTLARLGSAPVWNYTGRTVPPSDAQFGGRFSERPEGWTGLQFGGLRSVIGTTDTPSARRSVRPRAASRAAVEAPQPSVEPSTRAERT